MKPIFQTVSNPGETGDCFAACVASVMELPLTDVPHFYRGMKPGAEVPQSVIDAMADWFTTHDACYVEFGLKGDLTEVTSYMEKTVSNRIHYLLIGNSGRGTLHCVVAKGGKIVHDPISNNPQTFGLKADKDGFFRIGLFCSPM